MMNYIWGGFVVLSFACAAVTGRMHALSSAILSGAGEAVSLLISMLGMMCFWTGLMKIAEKGGLTQILSRVFSPILRRLFPEYEPNSPALRAICMNVTANLLGLGNAATPMGIAAMKEMQKRNDTPSTANNSMVMFVVLNTASLQLIPTMLSILREKHGAVAPFDVLPAIWFTSLLSLMVGVIAAKLLEKRGENIG